MNAESGQSRQDDHHQEETQESLVPFSRWEIDPDQSEILFSIRQAMISTVKGRFERFRGHIAYDDLHDRPAVVEVEIEAESISTGLMQRDLHLRSGDFFDVERHPSILFVSQQIAPLGENHYRVAGSLRMHGVTQPVTLQATFEGIERDPWGHERAAFTATTRVNRRDFGLTWESPMDVGGMVVGDTVRISLDVQAVRQS